MESYEAPDPPLVADSYLRLGTVVAYKTTSNNFI